jgi:D-Tyr-tRNAtyr deacylase
LKLLMLYTHDYWLQPHQKNLEDATEAPVPIAMQEGVVALIHIEPCDIETRGKSVTKAIKQLKWLARKFETLNIALHSFAHLAADSAAPEEAQSILEEMQERLTGTGFRVCSSPFGYFNEFKLHIAGPSLAKVFVEI